MHAARRWRPFSLRASMAAFLALSLMLFLALAQEAHAQTQSGPDDKTRNERMRALVGMTPITNYVPLPSSSLGNDKSATWFLDPNTDRVIHCAGNPTTGIRCTSTSINSR